MIEPEKGKPPDAAKHEAAKKPPRRRKWLRRLGWGTLAVAILAVVFHRPLLIAVLKTAATRFALHENVRLTLDVGGNLFTNLTISHVHAIPEGDSPVGAIDIESAEFHYSLARLIRLGPSDFLSSYRLRNATLVISPVTEKQKNELATLIRNILQQPALFSDKVAIENFNLTVNLPEGAFVLGGLNARLDPVEPGFLSAREITIPRIVSWRDLHAPATYINRNLIARDFQLGHDIRVSRVELDSSQRAKGIHYLSFEGNVLGGETGLFLWRQERHGKSFAHLTAAVSHLSLSALHDFFHWEPPLSGDVTRAWVQIVGNPEIPTTWQGHASLEAEGNRLGGIEIAHATAQLSVSGGVARLSEAELSTAGNRLAIESEHRLPRSTDDLFQSGLHATLKLDAPELSKLHPAFAGGRLNGSGEFKIEHGKLTLLLNTASERLEGTLAASSENPLTFALAKGTSQFHAAYELKRRPRGTPWFDGLSIQSTTALGSARFGSWAIDSGAAAVHLEEGTATVDSLELKRGPNTLQFGGTWGLPGEPDHFSWAAARFDAHFSIDAPSLSAFNAEPATAGAPPLLDGAIAASGKFHREAGETSGHAKLEASNLVFHEFSARRLTAEVPVEHNTARVDGFQLDLNGKDKLTGHGSLELREPYAYEAALEGSVQDLAVFQPLLKTPLAGSLEIDWHGSGELKSFRHSGEGRVAVGHGQFKTFTGIDGEIAGVYSPEAIELKTFHIRSDQGSAQAGVRLRDQRLQVDQLRLELGKMGVVTGTFALPLDLRTPEKPETILPDTGALAGKLVLEQIDLAKVTKLAEGATAPTAPTRPPPPIARERLRASIQKSATAKAAPAPSSNPNPSPADLGLKGTLDASITAAGTVAAPELTLTVQGRSLQARTAPKLQPASLDAALTYRQDALALQGTFKLPALSPIAFAGKIPVVLRKAIRERRIDPATPLQFSLKLPPSSAAVLAQTIPQLRYVEGKWSVDASASGTLEKPVFAGGLMLDIPAIRFNDSDLPGVNNFHGDLRFSGDQLLIRRFQGDISGGPFGMTGRILLANVTDPQLNLRFKSQGTLLVRNDSMIVRTDSDIKIAGPLKAAQVTGKVGINKSRFFREIEILPIGLPGRPAPKRMEGPPHVSIDIPPFRNWTFDIAIKTTEAFVVRSNLANGQAFADLRLGGTGLAPTLEGTARLENLTASLPFSRLVVDYGYVYFTPENPFDPSLDIHGTSRIRDHNINVYIYGTASAPETVFTSEPPLAQEEIIALLATGATTQEFTENSQVLAGRAGILVLQDLYHKIFKRRSPPPTGGGQPFVERFQLDVGTVDPRTGRQQVGGRFKLSNQFEVGAGLDVEGDVRVQLRYLLRFR